MRLLVSILGLIPLSRHLAPSRGWKGRPAKDRQALATAFLAKAVLGIPLTSQLHASLKTDRSLRLLCGWNSPGAVPHLSTFSRAFAEFAQTELPQQLHAALIRDTHHDRLVGHIARDSTAIEARERYPEAAVPTTRQKTKKYAPKPAQKRLAPPPAAKRKRGRPKKSERALSNRRLARQPRQTLDEMLTDLPRDCNSGKKVNSQGHEHHWRGYKLHIDVVDGQIPITCLLTSASLHDSQAAIPMATISAQRVTSLYDLMDAAYDAKEIDAHSRSLGHVPIIALNSSHVPIAHRTKKDSLRGYDKRRTLPSKVPRKRPVFTTAQEERFKLRTMSERVNARLKDEFGGRTVRVRGAAKVMAHLMFGIIALSVDQILRLTG